MKAAPKAPAERNPWPDRIKRMKDHQKAHSGTWRRNEKLLFGEETGQEGGANPNIVCYGWAITKALETQIYAQNPEAIADAQDPKWAETAKLLTGVVRYDCEQMDVKSIGNMLLSDCMVAGYGAVIETVETDSYRYPPTVDGEETVIPTDQNYFARRILPKDILFAPNGLLLDLSDHPYIALAWYPTISELRRDTTMTVPSDIESYRASSPMMRDSKDTHSFSTRPNTTEETDPDFKTICVWEIWDKVSGEIVYMTDDHEKIIGKRPWPFTLQLGGRKLFPVTLLALHPVPTGFYPKPQLDLVATQLLALNKLEAMLMKDLTTKWRKYFGFAKFFNADAVAAFTDPTDADSLILVDDDGFDQLAEGQHAHQVNINNIIGKADDVSPPRDVPMGIAHMKEEIQEILGYGPMDRGGLPAVRSAREAVAIKDRQDRRLGKLADAVTSFYQLFCAKHIQILQRTMLIPRYARIRSDFANLTLWKKYEGDHIAGDFEFIVYAGTSTPRTTEAKRASERELFQTIAPVIQATGGDIRPAFRRLAKYEDWDGIDDLFKGQQQAIEQLAIVLVAMGQTNVPPQALLEAASGAVKASLTDEQITMLKQRMAGGGVGSAPAPGSGQQRGDPNALQTSAGSM